MRNLACVTTLLFLNILTFACGGPPPAAPPAIILPTAVAAVSPVSVAPEPTAVPPTVAPTPAPTLVSETIEKEFEELDPRNFERSTLIDNEWFPLRPGTQLIYEGYTEEAGQFVPRRVVFTVTDLTKMINGVRTLVIYDQDYKNDQVDELELTFFAQDKEGNVWHLGQYREEYTEGNFVGSQAWMMGALEGAKAGIMMKAKPQPGLPSYSEGYAPAPFNWTDRARVSQIGQRVSVPYGNYDDVLVIEEFSRKETNAFQLKYYARNVGVVLIGWRGDDPNKESLELVDLLRLDSKALTQIHQDVLQLESRAYVYSHTLPAESAK